MTEDSKKSNKQEMKLPRTSMTTSETRSLPINDEEKPENYINFFTKIKDDAKNEK